jgi:hypothetical protein
MSSLLLFQILSPISDFAGMIAEYFAEIWDFLIFIGNLSSVFVVLIGAILWLTSWNAKGGKGLVASGILLAIVVQYFIFFSPDFVFS